MDRHLTAIFFALAVSSPVQADITQASLTDVSIAHASVVVEDDVVHRLMFRLANDSAYPITFTGITSPAVDGIELAFHPKAGPRTTFTEVTLLPDEEVDLSTSHLHAHLIGMHLNGDLLQFSVVLRNGVVEGEADVH